MTLTGVHVDNPAVASGEFVADQEEKPAQITSFAKAIQSHLKVLPHANAADVSEPPAQD
jgi:hypothetical protein